MATVLFGGEEVISHLSGGSASREFLDYLDGLNAQAGRFISENASRFMERVSNLRSRRETSEIKRMAIAVQERLSHFWQEDCIRPLERIEDVQNAPLSMQRWIVANPNVRRRIREGVLDGYSDSYVDDTPFLAPEKHADYQHVMSGLWVDDSVIEYFLDPIDDTKDTLDFDEKVAIRRSWRISDVGLELRRDVTSKWDVSF